MKILASVLSISLACTSAVYADTAILNDGTRLDGVAHRDDRGWIMVDATGKQTLIPMDQLKSFTLSGNKGPASDATRLASLRRSVDGLPSIDTIITRYQQFIATKPAADTLAAASSDLAVWQQRRDAGYVKLGSSWLTPEQRDARIAAESALAAQIADLLKQGRLQQAQAAINTALTDDPKNVSAIYLNGVMLATQGKTPPARDAFLEVIKAVPNHAPSFNNLAIQFWRLQLYPAAMLQYTQAMLSNPSDQVVLDNVAEALNALPDDARASDPAKKAALIFADQDKQLQQKRAGDDQQRWGATWVTAQQMAMLRDAEAKNAQKIAALDADMTATNASLASNQAQIQSTAQLLDQIQAPNYYQDNKGNLYRAPMPAQYYQLSQSMAGLKASAQTAQQHLQDLRAQEVQISQDIPIPKYTGLQHLIGAEGTPLLIPSAAQNAATQPAPSDKTAN